MWTVYLRNKEKMKRINYVDFIKGMAIIAMAFGHIMYFEQLHPLLLVKLFFAYTWHVGVFFIIGGFFLKNVNMSNIKAFIKKKTEQLYLLALYFVYASEHEDTDRENFLNRFQHNPISILMDRDIVCIHTSQCH